LEANSFKLTADSLIRPRIADLLLKNKEQAFMSQKLATIHKDVPIDFDLEKCRWGEYNRGELQKVFEELGFKSLLHRFGIMEVETHSTGHSTLRDEPSDSDSKSSGQAGRRSTEEQKKKDEQLKLL